VTRIKVTTAPRLRRLVEMNINEGGEGLILRMAKSLYLPGRNSSLIKLKVFSSFIYYMFINEIPSLFKLLITNTWILWNYLFI
jgi:hypothetical protein